MTKRKLTNAFVKKRLDKKEKDCHFNQDVAVNELNQLRRLLGKPKIRRVLISVCLFEVKGKMGGRHLKIFITVIIGFVLL